MTFVLPFIFAGCGSSLPESSGTFDDFSLPSPTWSKGELEAAITDNLTWGLPHALEIRNQYARALSFRDSECPPMLAEGSIVGTWEGDCTSFDHHFYGVGIFFEIENSAPDLPYEMAA